MTRMLIYVFGGLAAFAVNYVLFLSLIFGVDARSLIAGHLESLVSIAQFAGEIVALYAFFVYTAIRVGLERKIKSFIRELPIPVRVVRLFSFPGIRLPRHCDHSGCGGVLVSTTVCEPHSLAGADGKVLFPHSDNRCRIEIGLLAKYRQILNGTDRLFCTDCGTEYDWRVIRPMSHPLNLYNILPR